MVHSVISPSSAKTILACRPSLLVPAAKGGDGDNAYTSQGQAAHDLIEICGVSKYTEGELTLLPSSYLGQSLCGVKVDAEMVKDAEVFLHEVGSIMEANPGADVFFERRIVHSRVPEFGGTMDCLIVTDDALWILDFKFGMGQTVDVENNPQLLCYALLAMHGAAKPRATAPAVHLTVVQTRKPHPDGLVRTWAPSYETIDEFSNVLMECIQQYRERSALQEAGTPVYLNLMDEYTPTADNCRFCAAKANCPALQGMFKEYTMEPAFNPTYVARVLETEFLVRKHIDAVKIQAEAEMADGAEVPGFKRVTKYGNRRWDQALMVDGQAKFIATLQAALVAGGNVGLIPSDADISVAHMTGKIKSPAQLEKAGVPREVFEHLVERPVTGVKVVPVSDFGDDLDTDADVAFAALH